MTENRTVRDALLNHSDSRACREVWEAEQAGRSAPPRELVEALRASEGELAVEGWDGAARVHLTWNPDAAVFERLTCWPPATLAGFGREDGEGACDLLADLDGVTPVLAAESPLADGRAAALSGQLWP